MINLYCDLYYCRSLIFMKKPEKNKDMEKAVRLVWSSLESHLTYTYRKSSEGKRFHLRCVKEYAKILEIITKHW